jgi:hypothetical protein
VVTHTTPNFANPIGLNSLVLLFAQDDSNLISDLTFERSELKRLYDLLSENNEIKHWFYGHFHSTNTEEYNNTTFNLLGIDEFYNLN